MLFNLRRGLAKYTLAILGRPNVGKSTLFNILLSTRIALVDSTPGFTRDLREMTANIGGLGIRIVDTPGIDVSSVKKGTHLEYFMAEKSYSAARSADKVLFVVDAKNGVEQFDKEIVRRLKKQGMLHKTVLVANKSQNVQTQFYQKVYSLGLGEPAFVSAQQGTGVKQLQMQIFQKMPPQVKEQSIILRQNRKRNFQEMLQKGKESIQGQQAKSQWIKLIKRQNPNPSEDSEFDEPVSHSTRPIKISVVGRPNVGKSSLVNRLLNQDRMLVHHEEGTTRDSIHSKVVIQGRRFELVDTAGIVNRKKGEQQHQDKVYADLFRAMRASDVVIFLLDLQGAFRTKDYDIMQRVVKEGKAMVVAVNKWDLFDQKFRKKAEHYLGKQLERSMAELNGVRLIKLSAEKNYNTRQLLQEVIRVHETSRVRIPTGKLNNWLSEIKKVSKVPNKGTSDLVLKVIYQTKTKPPSFVLFVNSLALVKKSYTTFLKRKLSQQFGLAGIVLRFKFIQTKKQLKERLGQRMGTPKPARRRPASPKKEDEFKGLFQEQSDK